MFFTENKYKVLKVKKFIVNIFLLSVLASAFALEVNTSELRNVNSQNEIEFVNYEGPHAVINTAASIKGIGAGLGSQVSDSPEASSVRGDSKRYSVIHAVDLSVKEKLDADILIIGEDAQVDHIKNVRRIISGYLQSAYGYSEQDADTLAVFVTVYNAVYRGYKDLLSNKYKTVVLDYLDEKKCGLSTVYTEWPGKSQIIIPLYDVMNGGLSTIDTSVISDKAVIGSMKEDDDMNIDSRKNLVDLKERESDQAYENAKAAQKQAVEEQKKLDEEKAKTAQLEKETAEADRTAKELKETAENNPEDENAQQDYENASAEAKEKQKELENQRAAEQKQAEKTESAKETARDKQALADRKDTEAQGERKEISKDQSVVQAKQAADAAAVPEFAMVLVDEKKQLSRLVKYNAGNGAVIKNSPVAVIRNREFFKVGENYIVIAGENKNTGAVKLVLIDPEKLEIVSESSAVISETSMLVRDGNNFYCVTGEKSDYYLGKFNESLELSGKSEVKIKANTPITITDNAIVVTGADGKLKALNRKDISRELE